MAGELELRMSGEFIFVNETRLRLDLDNFASFSHLLALFRGAGIGSITLGSTVEAKDWLIFLSLLQSPSTDDPAARFDQLVEKLSGAGVSAFSLTAAMDQHDDDLEKNKERAKRTYAQSVAATRDLMTSVRMGAGANIKKIKRVVQGIVDQILNEETSLIGLTTLRDYDEYTFTHSVNVCIFAVALGKRLGLTKLQLYDLGMAALFHDIGKSRVPQALLNKADGLSEDEWRAHGRAPVARRARAVPDPRRAGAAVPVHGRGVRAPHEARPHRISASDAPAENGRVQQDRRDRRQLRRGDVPARLSDGSVDARPR